MTDGQGLEKLLEQGLAALEIAEFDEAIEFFGSAAVKDSANQRAWFYLGLCYLETRQLDLAIESLNRAIAADPHYADAHYLLGTAVGAAGNLDQAASSYRRALAIQPGHHKAEEFLVRTEALLDSRQHYRDAMALIYASEREPDWLNRAARELLQSIASFKDSPANGELARLAKEVIDSGASEVISGDTSGEGPFWAGAIKRAERAFAARNWPEASVCYNEALELSSDYAFIHHALGLIYFALGDTEGGRNAWHKVVDLEPDFDFSALRRLSR